MRIAKSQMLQCKKSCLCWESPGEWVHQDKYYIVSSIFVSFHHFCSIKNIMCSCAGNVQYCFFCENCKIMCSMQKLFFVPGASWRVGSSFIFNKKDMCSLRIAISVASLQRVFFCARSLLTSGFIQKIIIFSLRIWKSCVVQCKNCFSVLGASWRVGS